MGAVVVLVHGAWHGAWCWDKVVPLLDAAGVQSVAIDLPGHGQSPEPLGDLHTDAAVLTSVLDAVDGDAVVCGHSYGGGVITQARHPRTQHLVYLAAFQIDQGESVTAAATSLASVEESSSDLASAMQRGDDGTVTLDPDVAARVLYNDCSEEDIAWALPRLGPQRFDSLTQPADRAAWHDIPSTYVVCSDDLAVPPPLQRALAARAGDSVDWPTSHSPFLSRPELVADLLVDLSTRD